MTVITGPQSGFMFHAVFVLSMPDKFCFFRTSYLDPNVFTRLFLDFLLCLNNVVRLTHHTY